MDTKVDSSDTETNGTAKLKGTKKQKEDKKSKRKEVTHNPSRSRASTPNNLLPTSPSGPSTISSTSSSPSGPTNPENPTITQDDHSLANGTSSSSRVKFDASALSKSSSIERETPPQRPKVMKAKSFELNTVEKEEIMTHSSSSSNSNSNSSKRPILKKGLSIAKISSSILRKAGMLSEPSPDEPPLPLFPTTTR